MIPAAAISSPPSNCHPETESKDLYPANAIRPETGNSHIITRSGEHTTNSKPLASRETAKEFSPRREPWGSGGISASPNGAKEGPADFQSAASI
jgi:hypothetical protein